MSYEASPPRFGRGDSITHGLMNRIVDGVLQRITIVGGRIERHGNSLAIMIPPPSEADVPTGEVFHLRITGATEDGSNKRWTYTGLRVRKESAGFGGWVDHDDDTVYNIYNTIEDQNDGVTYGIGVTQAEIDAINDAGAGDGTFAVGRIPNGTRVACTRHTTLEGDIEYWVINYNNAVSGACPAAS